MQKMLFVAVLLCDFYANCADIMQIVLFLCKLWGFYANSAVLMQIVLFWCKLSHLSQFTLFCCKWHFCRKIRALAGTFGSAIRRLLLLMMSALGHHWRWFHAPCRQTLRGSHFPLLPLSRSCFSGRPQGDFALRGAHHNSKVSWLNR